MEPDRRIGTGALRDRANGVRDIDHVVGVDLLRAASGWKVLEANDCPVGVSEADRLSRSVSSPLLRGDATRRVAEVLGRLAGGGVVGVVVPRGVPVPPSGGGNLEPAAGGRASPDELAANDVSALRRALGDLGVESEILRSDEGALLDEERASRARAMYLNLVPGGTSNTPSGVPMLNRAEVRRICGDKLVFARCMAQLLDDGDVPRTVGEDAGEHDLAWLEEMARDSGRVVVVKPRFGFGSRGVVLERAETTLERLVDRSGAEPPSWPSGWLVQPWLEPGTCCVEGREYYFDLRIIVVNGVASAGFGRRAAAPVHGIRPVSNPLRWLTTLGPRVSVRVAGEAGPSALALSRDEGRAVVDLAERVAAGVEMTARSGRHEAAGPDPRSGSLPGPSGSARDGASHGKPLS